MTTWLKRIGWGLAGAVALAIVAAVLWGDKVGFRIRSPIVFGGGEKKDKEEKEEKPSKKEDAKAKDGDKKDKPPAKKPVVKAPPGGPYVLVLGDGRPDSVIEIFGLAVEHGKTKIKGKEVLIEPEKDEGALVYRKRLLRIVPGTGTKVRVTYEGRLVHWVLVEVPEGTAVFFRKRPEVPDSTRYLLVLDGGRSKGDTILEMAGDIPLEDAPFIKVRVAGRKRTYPGREFRPVLSRSEKVEAKYSGTFLLLLETGIPDGIPVYMGGLPKPPKKK